MVHALHPIHKYLIGLRGRKLGLFFGSRDGTDHRDVSSICSFSFTKDPNNPFLQEDILGEVVAIPMSPEQMLADQEMAVQRMHHAVKWSERDGIPVDVVGLGSLCSIVGSRGQALQEKLTVPVTTGNAATVWALYKNALQINPHKKPMALLGAKSPVGKALGYLLHQERIPLIVDAKKSIRPETANDTLLQSVGSAEECAAQAEYIIGCGPTGPILDAQVLRQHAVVLDVALPYSFTNIEKRPDVHRYYAERMSMPSNWHRRGWGRIYHMASGYGYQTILACLVEAAVLSAVRSNVPFAQGRSIEISSVLQFGEASTQLGFLPVLSEKYWHLWG